MERELKELFETLGMASLNGYKQGASNEARILLEELADFRDMGLLSKKALDELERLMRRIKRRHEFRRDF